MDFKRLLSRARFLALVFPLHGLLTAGGVGCGSVSTNAVSTSSSLYGAFGKHGNGHAGYYGYYGCTDGYGYDDPIYGIGCDDGSTTSIYGDPYGSYGNYGYGGYGGYGYAP
jgi:hypothetical protein